MKWYHNGTEITSSTRVSIANNGTSLTISNMIDSDAGKYEVKIGSIGRGSSTACDRNFLPILEVVAMTAPVTFIVQQYHIPKYNPEDIIKTITLDIRDDNLVINNSIKINSSHIYRGNANSELLKNGVRQSLNNGQYSVIQSYGSETLLSHQIRYNNTEEVAGHYVYYETAWYFYFGNSDCTDYSNFIFDYFHFPGRVAIFALYWTLKESGENIMYMYAHVCMFI